MKLKIILPIFIFTLLSIRGVNAQQIFKITQYSQHNFLYNPAAAGAEEHASVGAIYRKMWSGIDGGPQTTLIFGDKYFAKQKVGVSAVLYDDNTGPTSRTGGQVGLSYSIEMKKDRRLMFGLGGQVQQFSIDKDKLSQYASDPALMGKGNSVKADLDAGIYYRSPTLSVGAGVKQLVQSKLDIIKDVPQEGKLYRHYFFTANYNIVVDEDNVLVPSALLKYVENTPIDFEAGLRIEHKDLMWIGFGYHYNQDFSAFAGLKIKHKFAIGYAFDVYNTPLSLYESGSGAHELSLRYYFIK